MTPRQESAVEHLARTWGRTYVREGYTDDQVRVTIPDGGHFKITEDGFITVLPNDNSVDWTQ